MIKIAILSSYNGSGFDALHEASKSGILNAQIVLVISNNTNANVLKNAQKRNIANFVINQKRFPNENIDDKITKLVLQYECDFVFLSGYMKKIEKNLLQAFPNKIINSHPSLLPSFGGKGMYGRFVHEAVVKAKEKQTGVSIHFVNEHYDEGEYILQKSINISQNESVDLVESRVKKLEVQAIVEAFIKISKEFYA